MLRYTATPTHVSPRRPIDRHLNLYRLNGIFYEVRSFCNHQDTHHGWMRIFGRISITTTTT